MWKETATKVDRRQALVRWMVLLLVVLVLVLAAYLYGRSQSPAGVSEENKQSVALFVEALNAVEEDYVDQEEIDPKEQTYKGDARFSGRRGAHTLSNPGGNREEPRDDLQQVCRDRRPARG